MDRFGYLYTRFSLAFILTEHTLWFLALVVAFFIGMVVYVVGNARVKIVLGDTAKVLLVGYVTYNIIVGLSVGLYLLYQKYYA